MEGVNPMSYSKIPVLRPLLPPTDRLIPYLQRIDANRIYTNFGPLYYEFLDRLSDHLSCDSGSVACASSGTAAIASSILAVAGRPRAGRTVAIVPAFTFPGSALAAELCGYRVIFADVSAESWTLDPSVVRNIPHIDKVGVVIPVAPFGHPVDPRVWKRFQAETGIPIVIDAAACFEAIAREPGRYISDIPSVLSFHATKSFSTGEGGCVISRDPDLIDRVTQSLNFGFVENRETEVSGFNGKMNEYNAAVGLAELDSWGEKQSALQGLGLMYQEACEARGIAHKLTTAPKVCSSYILFSADETQETKAIESNLDAAGISFRRWYGPALSRQKYFLHTANPHCPIADRLADTILGLPVAPDLDVETVSRICDQLVR